MTAQMIPFPRLLGGKCGSPQTAANLVGGLAELNEPCRAGSEYLNRPCRPVAELEAMLAAREARDVLAGHVGVLDSLTSEQRSALDEHDGPVTIGDGEKI